MLSSKNEGTPVVIIEALASGCPVAATNVGGVAEVLENGNAGFLLANDRSGFTSGLASAINSAAEAAARLSDEFRQKWAEKYSVQTLAERIDTIYRKTLKLRGVDD